MHKILDLSDASHDAWLQARRKGIGGSDAAAILGISPWNSALSVYESKVFDPESSPETEVQRWGHRLEDAVAAEFSDRTSLTVTDPQALFAHPTIPWCIATPDRFYSDDPLGGPDGLLEIKTSRRDAAWADGVPDYYQVQVQHYLAVTGLAEAFLSVLLHGSQYQQWHIPRDDSLIEDLLEIEAGFWRRVEERRPPAPDDSESAAKALARLYPGGAEPVEVSNDLYSDLVHLAQLKAEEKKVADEKRALENRIKAGLGNHTVGTFDGAKVVAWSPVTRKSLDTKALTAAHPHLAAEFTTESQYRRLTVSVKGGK